MYLYPEALNALEKVAIDLFKRAYPSVVWNVRLVADSVTGTASVDWSGSPLTETYIRVTINMPIRKATYRMTQEEFDHWAAYLLHEVGHPLHTSKAEWILAVAARKHKLLNYLEDVREEKATIALGIAANAVAVFSRLFDMLHAKAVAQGYDPNALNDIGWTISIMGRYANGYAVDVSDIHAKLDRNSIVGRILPWALPELDACQSTADCRALGEKIIKAVNAALKAERDVAKQAEEPATEEIVSSTEEMGGKSEDRPDGAPEADSDLGEEGEEGGDSSPVIPDDEAEDIEADAKGRMEDREGDQPGQEPEPEPEEDLFKDEDIEDVDIAPNDRDDLVSSGTDGQTHRQVTAILRKVVMVTDSVLKRPITGRLMPGSAAATVPVNASKMGRQRALLARAMKANDIDDYESGKLNGRIDRRAIHKLATGTSNAVFGTRHMSEGYDTDVQILVDGSGSMAGPRIVAAATLALVVAQAASQMGVRCEAHLFEDKGLLMMTTGRNKPEPKKFAYAYSNTESSTPLTKSLLTVAHLQHKRASGKRKILFVITDGDCDLGHDVVKAAGQYVESTGTEVANLHIGRIAMGLFRNEVAVDVYNVAKVGLKQLTLVLEGGAS
jgi:Mg-chelatase subunit ChlD